MRPMALALIVASLAARQSGFHSWVLICHCDAFAMGGLLALALALADRGTADTSRALARRFALLGSACLVYLLVVLPLLGGRPLDEERGPWALNLTVVAAFFASVIGLVVLHAGRPSLAPLRARWLTRLGTISYGIYLYHIAVLLACVWLLRRLGLPTIAAPAISAPLTLAVASASWAWIETPFLRLKDRFPYRRPAPSPVSTRVPSPLVGEG
jgi:peptidoglycan/LPS O-acetylase OafA/YrhL